MKFWNEVYLTVKDFFGLFNVVKAFVLFMWELPRQSIMCAVTPSDEWQAIQDAKWYEELQELCPNGTDAFEITLKQEDFE